LHTKHLPPSKTVQTSISDIPDASFSRHHGSKPLETLQTASQLRWTKRTTGNRLHDRRILRTLEQTHRTHLGGLAEVSLQEELISTEQAHL
jgi:hypothetical protein